MAQVSSPELVAFYAGRNEFAIEAWTLLAVGLLVTLLRTYARARAVGLKGLQGDDYLVWLAAILYIVETTLAFYVTYAASGLANNGMTNEQREALSSDSVEFKKRAIGSKIQLAGWSTYSVLLWSLKASLLVFYTRLTTGLHGYYLNRIHIGFFFVAISWIIVILNLFAACRPFHRYWQISPDPGSNCHPAVSNQIIWMFLAFNVSTDLYLISIPLPMLWQTTLKPLRKIGLMLLLGGGSFVAVCATLRCILIFTDTANGAQLAGSWAVRETFLAVVATNLPMVFPLFKTWLCSVSESLVLKCWSLKKKKEASRPLPAIDSSHGSGQRNNGISTLSPVTNLPTSGVEEHTVQDTMQRSRAWSEHLPNSAPRQSLIYKRVDIDVKYEGRDERSPV